MRSTSVKLPVLKPRNSIVRALLRRIMAVGVGRHIHARDKRKANHDDADLAQRVRECGEW